MFRNHQYIKNMHCDTGHISHSIVKVISYIFHYRCEFLQKKKSSEEIAQYSQSYKGFVHVTVSYNNQLFQILLLLNI